MESQVQDVSQFVHEPMIYANLNDPVNAILACLTLLGGLVTLIIAQYFATFAALPNGGLTTGTSIIGYVILIGLFLLYSTNCSFLLTPLPSTCTVRRFAVNFSYTMVFSGMLIKVNNRFLKYLHFASTEKFENLFIKAKLCFQVWSSLRLINSDKAKCSKPFTLLAYSAVFTGFQGITSGLWLALRPPATDFKDGKWICYPPDGLDYHLILSMIYPLMILLTTIILAIRTCSKVRNLFKQTLHFIEFLVRFFFFALLKSNNDEARWILISSSLVAIILCCWGVAVGTGVWQGHRTACTNLATSTILLICLYIPKIRKHSKLKKTMKVQTNSPPLSVDIGKECSGKLDVFIKPRGLAVK